jgi:hypothetical protein
MISQPFSPPHLTSAKAYSETKNNIPKKRKKLQEMQVAPTYFNS